MDNPALPTAAALAREAVQWMRKSLQTRGVLGAVSTVCEAAFHLLREAMPARRRLRYGDLDFDWDRRVDTTWANVPFATRLREVFRGVQYQPVDPAAFHESMRALPIEYGGFIFLDLGSGKGRALLLASDYPFRQIIGVEVLPELHAIAERNVAKYASDTQHCREICLWCGDARDFAFPLQPTVLYLFNPFPEPVLREVLSRLEQSVLGCPRPLVILYHNPVLAPVLADRRWLRQTMANERYAIFVSTLLTM